MADQSLLVLFQEVRGKTLELLRGLSESHAGWTPPGLHNTILWHAGHCYVVVEWIVMQALGREPTAPDGWFELFSWESRPAETPPDRWPTLAEVVVQIESQYPRLRQLFGDLTDEQLARAASGRRDRTVRTALLHALHDEACHGGEIWLLRKLQRNR